MAKIQVASIPASQKSSLGQLTRDFRAALSYVSFYSMDSPFVVQAIQKLHKTLSRFLQSAGSLAFYLQGGKLKINEVDLSELTELSKLFQEKNVTGTLMIPALSLPDLTSWLRQMALPITEKDPASQTTESSNVRPISPADQVEVTAEAPKPSPAQAEILYTVSMPMPTIEAPPIHVAQAAAPMEVPPFSMGELGLDEKTPLLGTRVPETDSSPQADQALLSFVAEAWQHSQLQKKNLNVSPEMVAMAQNFDKLFDRLLDRMEKATPEFRHIYQWFKSPPGELMEGDVVAAMYPLIEVAVRNGWTAVLFDPTTEGLVSDCLAHWGANGQHDLLEKTVTCLADNLNDGLLERQLALTHLMDARPWVGNPELVEKVLVQLNALLAQETFPALYQSGLLLAWDLLEPAMEKGKEQPVLTLLTTLHFHADEDIESFPDRSRIARHWLFERSTPDLTRKLTFVAYKAGQVNHYPLLGEMAAPVLLQDFFQASPTEKNAYFPLFKELKEPVRSALAEWLADPHEENEVEFMLPVLWACGMDAALSLVLCSWLAKGSRELKLNLIGLIEEVHDTAAGPALRLAVFDDSQEIAALAARVIGKIRFTPALPVLLKAAKIRESRYPDNEQFLVSACEALGDLGQAEALPFLQDIARKKPLLRGKNFSLAVRLAAIQAITKLNKPEAWHFVESLMEEKNPALQEALDKIIHERSGHLSS